MLQHGMTDSDFAELAAQGVHVVGEIGMSDVKDVEEASAPRRDGEGSRLRHDTPLRRTLHRRRCCLHL